MQSIVTVQAHCADGTEVVVNVSTELDDMDFIVQNGESSKFTVWGDKAILVYERIKQGE